MGNNRPWHNDLPTEILPARKERLRVHFGRFKKLVNSQRQLQTKPLLYSVVQEENRQSGIVYKKQTKDEF